MISGHATATGTARFRARFPDFTTAGHFRLPNDVLGIADLWLSSIGLGTYLGEPDSATDVRYTDAVIEAVCSGVNVLDSAINYRFQRSERSIGAAIAKLMDSGVARDELFLCTKAGYLTYDASVPADPRAYFMKEYIESGIIPQRELVGGMHCMAPSYLADQIGRSRRNLGIETIDLFYLHNPEQQLSEVTREVFYTRIQAAFAALESAVAEKKIRIYGTATWNGFRQEPTSREYLDLTKLESIAREVGGEGHHFRAIQLPFNLGLPEAFTLHNQKSGDALISTLQLAQEVGIAVFTSATLMQGRLTAKLPSFVRERMRCDADAEAAIQFARSAPGVTTALVGMSRKDHVQENLKVAFRPEAPQEDWRSLFERK
jgi:aryl-alcohol dehydrogenase-like predicted oxidoreductase